MNNDVAPDGLLDILNRTWTWVGSLITAVTCVIGVIRLWKGDAGLVTIALLIVGAGILFIILLCT